MACPDCLTGFIQGGTPKGREGTLHGRKVYIAEPDDATSIKGIIVIVPDAFGWEFVNNRIIADNYAAKGDFRVYLPDFMDGTAAPVWVLEQNLITHVMDMSSLSAILWKPYYVSLAMYAMVPFVIQNRFGAAWPRVKSFFEAVRTNEGASQPIGAAGFCWGGKHIAHLAQGHEAANHKPLVDAVFTAHPSFLKLPDDIEKIKKPTSIAIGDKDYVLSMDQVKQIQTIFNRGQEDAQTPSTGENEVKVYPGAGHGFAVRADVGNAEVKRDADGAEEQAITWFLRIFSKLSY